MAVVRQFHIVARELLPVKRHLDSDSRAADKCIRCKRQVV